MSQDNSFNFGRSVSFLKKWFLPLLYIELPLDTWAKYFTIDSNLWSIIVSIWNDFDWSFPLYSKVKCEFFFIRISTNFLKHYFAELKIRVIPFCLWAVLNSKCIKLIILIILDLISSRNSNISCNNLSLLFESIIVLVIRFIFITWSSLLSWNFVSDNLFVFVQEMLEIIYQKRSQILAKHIDFSWIHNIMRQMQCIAEI